MCVRAAWGARGTSADNTLEVAGRRGLSSTRRSLCACLLSLYRTLTYSSSLHRQQQQPPPSREQGESNSCSYERSDPTSRLISIVYNCTLCIDKEQKPQMSTTTAAISANKDTQQHERNRLEAGHYVVTSHRASSVTNALRCSFLGPDTTVRQVSLRIRSKSFLLLQKNRKNQKCILMIITISTTDQSSSVVCLFFFFFLE